MKDVCDMTVSEIEKTVGRLVILEAVLKDYIKEMKDGVAPASFYEALNDIDQMLSDHKAAV